MFFVVVGTHSKCVINDFTLTTRIDILIFQRHTVTNGTDLRKSPHQQLVDCASCDCAAHLRGFVWQYFPSFTRITDFTAFGRCRPAFKRL